MTNKILLSAGLVILFACTDSKKDQPTMSNQSVAAATVKPPANTLSGSNNTVSQQKGKQTPAQKTEAPEPHLRFVPPTIVEDENESDASTGLHAPGMQDKDVLYTSDIVPERFEEPATRDVIYELVEEPPHFPPGKTLQEYMQQNVIYPAAAKENGIEGKVYVQFVVKETGEITSVKVARGVPGLTEEAVRVVKNMPNWIPGKINGKAVNSQYVIPVVFKLN